MDNRPLLEHADNSAADLGTEGQSKNTSRLKTTVQPLIMVLLALYMFLVGLSLISTGMKVLSGPALDRFFHEIKEDPLQGLATGILVTVLVQSSSTTSSIVVVLAALGKITVNDGIPVIMGANIGTSISSTLMALAHSQSDDKREFPRAFSGAVVSDVFNILGVFVFFPLHLLFKLFFNGKGFFELITGLFVDPNSQKSGTKIPNVVKVATGPMADLVLKINKDVYKVLSGPGMPELGVTETVQNKFGIDYNIGQNRTRLAVAQKIYNEKIAEASLIKGGLMKAVGASNAVGGALCLVIAIGIVIWALLQLVASLKKLLLGGAQKALHDSLDMNDYVAILIGILMTFAVQSSSITTSTLVPLVAIGALKVEKSLPMCIGANIGTCGTSLIAASATDDPATGVQIALVHLTFNICTFLLWFPVKRMRQVPVDIALEFGRACAVNRKIPVMYLCYCYILAPAIIFGAGIHESPVFGIVAFTVLFAIPIGLWTKYLRPVKLGYGVFELEPENDADVELLPGRGRNSWAATEEK
jgi:solute carrier family 34 (sodium-dependent phosphate cotransporter)